MKRTYRYSNGQMVEVTRQPAEKTHFIIPDIPDYQSPIDDRIVHGRKGRRYDLQRSGSRPWEGMQQEKQEEARRMQYAERESDNRMDVSVQTSWDQLHPKLRERLRNG